MSTTTTEPVDPHDRLDEALSAAVHRITDGAANTPRPGQRTLSHHAFESMLNAHRARRNTNAGLLGPSVKQPWLGGKSIVAGDREVPWWFGKGMIEIDATPDMHLSAKAGTGSGKSLAYSAPAMLMAALYGERTIVSTESIALQSQIVHKDAPLFAQAIQDVTGYTPTVALLKGWSNYVCHRSVFNMACAILDIDLPRRDRSESPAVFAARTHVCWELMVHALTKISAWVDEHERLPRHMDKVSTIITGAIGPVTAATDDLATAGIDTARDEAIKALDDLTFTASRVAPRVFTVDRRDYDVRQTLDLLRWAIDGGTDKDHVSVPIEDDNGRSVWPMVSVSKDECPGAAKCPFGSMCVPTRARAKAADADIIVTNHAYLAVQAATAAPVLVGNRGLGEVHHVVMDEAHTFPEKVRDAGGVDLSPAGWRGTISRVTAPLGDEKFIRHGQGLAEHIERELRALAPSGKQTTLDATVPSYLSPDLTRLISEWIEQAAKSITVASRSYDRSPAKVQRQIDRAKSSLSTARVMMRAVTGTGSETDDESAPDYETSRAVWVEFTSQGMPVLRISPVDVSGLIRGNIGTSSVSYQQDGYSFPMSMVCCSATLGDRFVYDMGLLRMPMPDLPAPFAAEQAASAFYVPALTNEQIAPLVSSRYGKPKFDTELHRAWCAQRIVELVEANGGSALVLAATSTSGRLYAQTLRESLPGMVVHSQWDGNRRESVDAWREDIGSVMVGTRSMMTGLDAPGQTCSLVIIDRPPRNVRNPIDDARAQLLIDRGMNQWQASEQIYAGDTALLIEQAVGRGIRRHGDQAGIAILDPRLVPKSLPHSNKYAYSAATSSLYLSGVAGYTMRTTDQGTFTGWLIQQRENRGTDQG